MTLTADTSTATDRLVAKLAAAARGEDVIFTAAQAVYLMGAASQWRSDAIDETPSALTYRAGYDAGYRARVAEENAAYPPETDPIYTGLTGLVDRVEYRRRCDAEARQPRDGDFPGWGIQYVIELRERWAFPDGDHPTEG